MKIGIDKDLYCSATSEKSVYCWIDECKYDEPETLETAKEDGDLLEIKDCNRQWCTCRHRKHPTPEQYKEEYGREYPDDGAVWFIPKSWPVGVDYRWSIGIYRQYKNGEHYLICASTPYGKPDDNWRPN